MKLICRIAALAAVALLIPACGEAPAPEQAAAPPVEDIPADIPETATEVQEVTSVGASHILVGYAGSQVQGLSRSREEAMELITGIQRRIADGEMTFAQAASEFSDCPSGRDGGALGVFGRGAMVAEFDQAVFALGVNEVSGIVETQFGYHLIHRTQ